MSRTRLVKIFGLCGVLVAAVAAPSAALADTQSASSGEVSAAFSWHSGNVPSGETLSISRAGKVVYHAPVSSPFCGSFCSVFPGGRYVFVARLERAQEPDVVLLLPNGGTGGGTAAQILSWNGHAYRKSEYDFDAPVRLARLRTDGRSELLSGDGRFECAFTPCAASGVPIKIELFGSDRFTNVTRGFPAQIRRDASNWLKAFKQSWQSGTGDGFIGAWAADEELLGQGKLVDSYLNQQLKAGHLNNLHGPSLVTVRIYTFSVRRGSASWAPVPWTWVGS